MLPILHLKQLESWMRSYKPEELFDRDGRLPRELAELAPTGDRRMGANPHSNGGLLLHDLIMPDFRSFAVKVPSPGSVQAADMHVLGGFLRDVTRFNQEQRNLRIFGPDETLSNRLNSAFEVTDRQWEARTKENDEFLATFNQHAKWLKVTAGLPWRREIASLNYLLASRALHAGHRRLAVCKQ